jgi:uncharacterized protein (TIGR00369 family)
MASPLEPRDPGFEARVRASFGRQGLMVTIGAHLIRLSPGEVEIEAPFGQGLTQQHGFVHAGIITALVDTACGYAALSLSPPDTEALTVEYKVNFLAPAVGQRLIARGRVIRAGRMITVCSGEVVAISGADEKQVAVMQATMISVPADREPRAS